MARLRPLVNAADSTARAVIASAAPAAPSSTRPTTTWASDWAVAATIVPATNTMALAIITRLRPRRSPSTPAANTTISDAVAGTSIAAFPASAEKPRSACMATRA